jgi:hypothetical protein
MGDCDSAQYVCWGEVAYQHSAEEPGSRMAWGARTIFADRMPYNSEAPRSLASIIAFTVHVDVRVKHDTVVRRAIGGSAPWAVWSDSPAHTLAGGGAASHRFRIVVVIFGGPRWRCLFCFFPARNVLSGSEAPCDLLGMAEMRLRFGF